MVKIENNFYEYRVIRLHCEEKMIFFFVFFYFFFVWIYKYARNTFVFSFIDSNRTLKTLINELFRLASPPTKTKPAINANLIDLFSVLFIYIQMHCFVFLSECLKSFACSNFSRSFLEEHAIAIRSKRNEPHWLAADLRQQSWIESAHVENHSGWIVSNKVNERLVKSKSWRLWNSSLSRSKWQR